MGRPVGISFGGFSWGRGFGHNFMSSSGSVLEKVSWEVARLQGGIGRVDIFQLFLGILVAAMGVGMVALHQFLIAHLEPRQRQRLGQVEQGQRLALERAGFASDWLRRRLLLEVENPIVAPFCAAQLADALPGAKSGAARPYRGGSAFSISVRSSRRRNLRTRYIREHGQAEPAEIREHGPRAWGAKFARAAQPGWSQGRAATGGGSPYAKRRRGIKQYGGWVEW